MLSQNTITIVKSTAPILQEHGETLTKHFYKRMFEKNPEVKKLFNPAHQIAGLQQKALAGAICAYASNIDNLSALGPAVERIAQKHASLSIKAEDYPIVGMNLLASIQEVLGAGATVEVIDAWQEAYEFLAKVLIDRESQIYQEHSSQENGWQGFKNFKVVRTEKESSIITSFYLAPADNAPLPLFKPGQYITIRVPSADGETTMRNYSLSCKPGSNEFRISVKKETDPNGYVSNYLTQQLESNAFIEVGPPCGDFFLKIDSDTKKPLVLAAGGIGITPLISMLEMALEIMPNREIIFVHGVLNEEVQPFKATLNALQSNHPNLKVHYRYSKMDSEAKHKELSHESFGFVDKALIQSLVSTADAEYYFCGPKDFMINLYRELMHLDVPTSQINFEFFGPLQELHT